MLQSINSLYRNKNNIFHKLNKLNHRPENLMKIQSYLITVMFVFPLNTVYLRPMDSQVQGEMLSLFLAVHPYAIYSSCYFYILSIVTIIFILNVYCNHSTPDIYHIFYQMTAILFLLTLFPLTVHSLRTRSYFGP